MEEDIRSDDVTHDQAFRTGHYARGGPLSFLASEDLPRSSVLSCVEECLVRGNAKRLGGQVQIEQILWNFAFVTLNPKILLKILRIE